jgi:hypothetical protein
MQLVEQLNRASVAKHFDAYLDVDWDASDHAIDPADPRWQLSEEDPVGASAWYRALPPETRSRLGLHMAASAMKIGWQFESVLQRGLLELAATLPDDVPELRYLYHEVTEEAQHTLMFMEFVRRVHAVAPLDTPGLPRRLRPLRATIIGLARRFPEAFMIFVLGGEDPIDHVQRGLLGRDVHPLLRRIMTIHVTEEARHLAFARAWLRARVPVLPPARRAALALLAPVVLAVMARLMLRPGGHLVRGYGMPPEVARSAGLRTRAVASLDKVRELCAELDLLTPRTAPVWRAVGIAPPRRTKAERGATERAGAPDPSEPGRGS